MEAVWKLRTLLITQCMKSEDKWMMIWGLGNERSKSGKIPLESPKQNQKKTPKSQIWSYDFQSLSNINPGVLDNLYVNIYIADIFRYACMHMYVFTHLKGG